MCDLQNKTDTKLEKRCINLGFLICAIVICIVVIGFCVYHHHFVFSTQKWLDNPEERTKIVDSLLRRHSLIGMTEDEIVALLGECDNTAGYFVMNDRYVYYMGPERGFFSIDSEWLLIDFENGVVSDYSVVTD